MQTTGVALAALYFLYCAFTPTDWHFIDFANLIFHEAGHTIFFFLGTFIQVAMGSGLQVLLPLFLAGYFFFTNQKISSGVTLMWAGQSMVNVSVYAGDAVAMELPLLGGDSVMHDWHYLLETTGTLAYTSAIANLIYALGVAAILVGTIYAGLVVKQA